MTEKISVTRQDHVLLIGINRPAKRNAFDIDMLHGLSEAYEQLEQDPELRCGVLHAHGDHFTAGLDLAAVAPHFRTGDWAGAPGRPDALGLYGPKVTKPVVSAVQGYCYTIGLELMFATEVRVAASDTRFAMLEVKRGIYPVGGATIRFVREAGWGNAMRYLLTGDEFGPEEARQMGLVQEITKPGEQLDRALELARRIAHQAPLGVRACMRSARLSIEEGEAAAIEQLLPDLGPILDSEDAQEGLAAFLERREARFQGK